MMPNNEDVIKALECCQGVRQCDICPYNSYDGDECVDLLLFDAERLLKQQQPKDIMALSAMDAVPVVHGRWMDKGSLSCRCSQCGCKSNNEYKYCPNCGAKMEIK